MLYELDNKVITKLPYIYSVLWHGHNKNAGRGVLREKLNTVKSSIWRSFGVGSDVLT